LAVSVVLLVSGGPVVAGPGDVKVSFDAPCKYPAGMTSDGEHLFVADWREAKIFQISRTDGKVTRSWDAPTLKPHGIAYAEGRLFVCDDHTGNVYTLNLDSGVVENTFKAPSSSASGLAFADGTLFILTKSKIHKVLPDDGTILGYFKVPDLSLIHI